MNNQGTPLDLKDGGTKAFFAGMAAQYNPKAEPDLEAVIQFKFEDEKYHLIIQQNNCEAYEGTHPAPTVTINSSVDVWMKISSGELSGAKAFMEKMYTVEGDMGLLLKMNRLFSESDSSEEILAQPRISPHKLEKITEKRGPLNIPGLLWLNIAFLPWIIFWIWYSISPGFIPLIIVTLISVLIMSYHLITNRPTFFETGSCIYLILATLLYWMNIGFFILYLKMFTNIFLGGLWLSSLTKTFSLTAEYSRHGLPKAIWSTRAFLKTNNILTGVWGVFFLYSAVMDYIAIMYPEFSLLLMIIGYLLLIPMFLFTSWFQKWYPSKIG
jgi:putative sterol carrier protein